MQKKELRLPLFYIFCVSFLCRNVITEVVIDIKHKTLLNYNSCHLQLIEHIPTGVYVDLYQIKTTTELKVHS